MRTIGKERELVMKELLNEKRGIRATASKTIISSSEENMKIENVKIMTLNTADLISSQPYQRNLDQKKIAQIVTNFDKHKFGVPKVSYRKGKYYVFDGQHRIAAIRIINGNTDCLVQCEVHFGLTYEDEASYFAQQYDGATKVDINFKWKALYEARSEPIYTIVNNVEAIGIEVSFTKSKTNNRIIALKQLFDMWDKLGMEDTLKLLQLMKQFWDSNKNTYNENIMNGMKEFYAVYKNEIREETFIKQMKKSSPVKIEANGKTDLSTKGALKYAKVIWNDYNFGLQKNRLDYKFKG